MIENVLDADDAAFREHLTKSIELDRAPEPDPEAVGRLTGLLSDDLPSDFDATEAVKEVRGSG